MPDFAEGSFVWTNFPFGPPNRPDLPGPMPHIAYVLGRRGEGRAVQVMLAYTSSGLWRPATSSPPIGVIEFDATAAVALQQKAFHIDLRCLARVPPTAVWFPHIGRADGGVVAIAGARIRDRIGKIMVDLATRHADLIEIRGPR